MAYSNKNYQKKRRKAYDLAQQHYEPGRHDRCYKWVWAKVIREVYDVEYCTFLRWIREEKALRAEDTQQNLF